MPKTFTRAARPPSTDSALSYRTLAVRTSTCNADQRSVEGTIATESPVPMYDWKRGAVIPEILRADGAELPSQVPFLNAHHRYDVNDQLGSARELRIDNGQIAGRMFFARKHADQYDMVADGHVTDLSAGYQVVESTHVPRGEKAIVGGRSYEGPVNVVTKWKLREVSLVPIGADEQAKLRGLDRFPGHPPETTPTNPTPKRLTVNEALRAFCVTSGMDEKLTDEQARAWMETKFGRKTTAKLFGERSSDLVTEDGVPFDFKELIRQATTVAAEAARTAVLESQRVETARVDAFRKEVDAACELASLEGERSACYAMPDITSVRKHLLELKSKQPDPGYGIPIRGGEAQRDKHVAALTTALGLRALQATNCRQELVEQHLPPAQRAAGHETFRNASLLDIARECLQLDGFNTRGLSREQIAIASLGWPHKVGLRADFGSTGPAYHTTGSFSKLTADAVNKSMQVGYQEFPATWRTCFRQGPSAADLKTIHRIRMGAIPNLPDWPTNTDPEQASFKDAEETYRVQPKSLWLSFSWDLLVNDDLNMLSRVPAMFGDAAARTVNALAWAQITGNPTMEDGQALFLETATGNRKRSNLTTGAGTPSVATRQTLTNKMRQMRGENTPEGNESQDILNLEPRFIVGGSTLETLILQLVKSGYDPAANQFQTYNPATTLTPIIEPLLDANSTTAWYLFADTARIDTVEVTFLQGHEAPVQRSWADEKTLSQNWAVLQAVAAKALNHRGMQKHNGS
jgi:hypothetical protein